MVEFGLNFFEATMSDAVNTIGGISAQKAIGVALSPAESVKQDLPKEVPTLVSRLYDDPIAGVLVTQQLDQEGQVVAQNPPGSVVAYLRNGQTVQGYSKAVTA